MQENYFETFESNKIVDILGNGFLQMSMRMKPDSEGDVFCTLVCAGNIPQYERNVLYVHGFSDYFFQTEMAEQFRQNGYNFYAIDLRKCGRSIRPWQTPYNLYDITDYYEDIDAAITQIRKETKGKLILAGHSMGGLVLSMYLHDNPINTIEALILNSPFLDLDVERYLKTIGLPIVSVLGKFFPNIRIKRGLSLNYGYSISKKRYGEWEYDENWKPIAVSEVSICWLRAIYKAQNRLHKGLNIGCPVLVMRSDKSVKNKLWSDKFRNADAVLNVEHINKYALLLGENVTEIVIANGLHDLFLSAGEVRTNAYKRMFEWLSKNDEH
ncbi:MAG: alpha/beta hydrolase [Prevotellaceae bacterium]|jgi:alpha-beta hydrolase superfamily lysophospholipase|nr:alpha/beta hydrolase [Prevotellaceae bacterium]